MNYRLNCKKSYDTMGSRWLKLFPIIHSCVTVGRGESVQYKKYRQDMQSLDLRSGMSVEAVPPGVVQILLFELVV